MATSGGGTPQANQRRQPLGLLGPGTGPRAGPSVQQHQARASKLGQEGAAGMSPSVAISRVRRGGGASPQQRQGLQVSFQQQQKMGTPKDGKFYRPSPRIRRGSWGGEMESCVFGVGAFFRCGVGGLAVTIEDEENDILLQAPSTAVHVAVG